jgi:uncharacterized protein (TIGR02186 family)
MICAVLFAGFVMAGAVHAADSVSVTSSPADILMDARYDGATLNISGEVPAGCDVVVRLVGEPESIHLREKGKVGGLLWMNVGTLAFDNVPRIYLAAASRGFDELGQAGGTMSIAGLHDRIAQEHASASKDLDAVAELLRLKVRDGLYAESSRKVRLADGAGDARAFTASLSVPSAITPGTYTLEAMAVRDGAIVGTASAPVQAKLVGLPAWLSHLAFDNGLLYGILATVIAILSGLAIGVVFQSKGAH